MNNLAIKREIYLKPFGYNLFGEHYKRYNPIDNNDSGNGLFGFYVRTSVAPFNGTIVMEVICERECTPSYSYTEERYKGNIDDFVQCIMVAFQDFTEKHGEDYSFGVDDFNRWESYIRDYVTSVVRLELTHANLVKAEMVKSDLFKDIDYTKC